jgi:HEPN domain-containing protein
MAGKDPGHWLYRLTSEEWLRAAEKELGAAEQALAGKHQRAGVASARRAAGMAWNAVLVHTSDETGYGRSYMDHLQAIARAEDVPEVVRQAARQLLDAPLGAELIKLGAHGDTRLAREAEAILEHARARVRPQAEA